MNHQIHADLYLVAVGAIVGAATTLFLTWISRSCTEPRIYNDDDDKKTHNSRCLAKEENIRENLPALIILVRHGESESNADHTLWRKKADNLIELSSRGIDEAEYTGEELEKIFKLYDEDESLPSIERVHMIVSPFERTLQTSFFIRQSIDHRVVRTDVETRIREQEFGNLQGDEFQHFREEQKEIGRFWYRFPTGESGADVYDRVKSWWFESVLTVNCRVGYDPVDALVVVTHGLTMRFVLMQLFHWSPTTFHSVWNADNCDFYVLRKDLQKPGLSPYVLDDKVGEMPRSNVKVLVTFKNEKTQIYNLSDYLSIPPPRSIRFEIIRDMLGTQYPELDTTEIKDITVAEGVNGPIRAAINKMTASRRESGESEDYHKYSGFQTVERERSSRFPNLDQVTR